MLDYSILKGKAQISLPYDYSGSTETVCTDLLSMVIDPNNIVLNDCNVISVTKDYVARPDLVSLAIYGDDKYADIICKINGISNPFELNAGMILFIPDLTSVLQLCKLAKRNETINDNKYISTVLKTNQKTKNELRSPSEQIVGENTFIIDRTNKLIYY